MRRKRESKNIVQHQELALETSLNGHDERRLDRLAFGGCEVLGSELVSEMSRLYEVPRVQLA